MSSESILTIFQIIPIRVSPAGDTMFGHYDIEDLIITSNTVCRLIKLPARVFTQKLE